MGYRSDSIALSRDMGPLRVIGVGGTSLAETFTKSFPAPEGRTRHLNVSC